MARKSRKKRGARKSKFGAADKAARESAFIRGAEGVLAQQERDAARREHEALGRTVTYLENRAAAVRTVDRQIQERPSVEKLRKGRK